MPLSRPAASNLLTYSPLTSWLLHPHCSRRALFLPTLRTSHPLRHILEPSIPAAQSTERFRLGSPFMAARGAFEDQRVLTELIAEFLDMKSTRHATNCYDTSQMRPSSNDTATTLYKTYTAARQRAAVNGRCVWTLTGAATYSMNLVRSLKSWSIEDACLQHAPPNLTGRLQTRDCRALARSTRPLRFRPPLRF